MSVAAINRLSQLSTLFQRFAETKNLKLPESVKVLSGSAARALAQAVDQVKPKTVDSTGDEQQVRSAFADMGASFLAYLKDLKLSQRGKGLDLMLTGILSKFPFLKNTIREQSNAEAKAILGRIRGYDYHGTAHPKELARIEEIYRLLEWYQEGHGKEFLEQEFGIKPGQLQNYIFQILGQSHICQTPRDVVISIASRDIQGTRHDYAGVDKGKPGLKLHVRFLKLLEDALQRTDLPESVRTKLTVIRDYAFAKDTGRSVEQIQTAAGVSRQTLGNWIKYWNHKSKGDPQQFFKREWKLPATA